MRIFRYFNNIVENLVNEAIYLFKFSTDVILLTI